MRANNNCHSLVISTSLSINIASVSGHGIELSPSPSIGLFVGLSVRKVACGKTADWIRMPFGMVSGMGRGMGVLDWMVIDEGEWAVLG